VPYRRIWVIGRTLATGRRDQARALRLIGDYRLSPPGGPRRFAAGCRPGRVRRAPRLTGLQFLDRLSAALRENPPPRRDRTQLRRLARIGVGAGLAPERAGLTAVAMHSLVTAVNATAASLPALAKATILAQAKAHHGWTTPPADTGDYGTDYVTRAAIAEVGLGANTPAEAMYPTAYADASGATFDASKRYRLRFAPGQAPPARAFWSLTLYDAAGYLVSNPEHRYAVGSSHPPLRREADGSIVVAIQSARPTEPGVNWLPAPRRGAFRLSLRLYWPRAAALDGEWAPPAVQQR
jgi:hypothetical protein